MDELSNDWLKHRLRTNTVIRIGEKPKYCFHVELEFSQRIGCTLKFHNARSHIPRNREGVVVE